LASFGFAVISPERSPFEGQVTSVSLRSVVGDIGFLAGHVPYIGVVRISVCEIVPESGPELRLAVHGGFVEVAPDGTVTLLADVVETPEEIDVGRATAARERASALIGVGGPGGELDPGAEAALARAEVRLEVAATLGGTTPARSAPATAGASPAPGSTA
jgi:F-type H+-transporting ATPase subunit epsilon